MRNHPLNTEFNLSPQDCQSLYAALLPTSDVSPSLETLRQLLAKVYESYKRDIVAQIRKDEQEYQTKLKEIEQIEKGQWDAELLKEMEQERAENSSSQDLPSSTLQVSAGQRYRQPHQRLQRQMDLRQVDQQEKEQKLAIQRRQLEVQRQLERQQQQQKELQMKMSGRPQAARMTRMAELVKEEKLVHSKGVFDKVAEMTVSQRVQDAEAERARERKRERARGKDGVDKEKSEDIKDSDEEEKSATQSAEEKEQSASIEPDSLEKGESVSAKESMAESGEEDEPKGESMDIDDEEEEMEEENEDEEKEEEGLSICTLKRKRQSQSPAPASQRRFQQFVNPLLSDILSNKSASFFSHPVNPNDAPNYYDLIYSPTDLRTIKSQIKDGKIRDTNELERELQKMFANAVMYNSWDSEMSQWAREMHHDAENLLAIFKDAERKGRSLSATPIDETELKRRKK